MNEPKTTQQLLREYADVRVFDSKTFSRVRTLMKNAAEELDQLSVRPAVCSECGAKQGEHVPRHWAGCSK